MLSRRSAVLALAPTLLLAVACPAAAQVFQPGTQPMGDEGGLTREIQAATVCSSCHSDYDDTDDYEPWDSWRGAMMANAARDPVFRAALSIAEVDNPDAADFCVRCHS